ASIAAAGYDPPVERLPDPMQPDLVARVRVREPRRDWIPIGALDAEADRRHTNRRRFSDEPVPPADVAALVAAADAEGAVLFPVERTEHRQSTARLSQLADEIENADPAYRAELRAWTTDGAATAYPRWPSRTPMPAQATRYRSEISTRAEWAGCRPRRSRRCVNACCS